MSDQIPRGPRGRRHVMDYITDPTLFKTVMFARRMMRSPGA